MSWDAIEGKIIFQRLYIASSKLPACEAFNCNMRAVEAPANSCSVYNM